MMFPFSTTRTVFQQKAPGQWEPRSFWGRVSPRSCVGEVRFCFVVTLLALWMGKLEFGDPRKMTEWQVVSRSQGWVVALLKHKKALEPRTLGLGGSKQRLAIRLVVFL